MINYVPSALHVSLLLGCNENTHKFYEYLHYYFKEQTIGFFINVIFIMFSMTKFNVYNVCVYSVL